MTSTTPSRCGNTCRRLATAGPTSPSSARMRSTATSGSAPRTSARTGCKPVTRTRARIRSSAGQRHRHRPVALRAEPAARERADRRLLRVQSGRCRHGHPQSRALAAGQLGCGRRNAPAWSRRGRVRPGQPLGRNPPAHRGAGPFAAGLQRLLQPLGHGVLHDAQRSGRALDRHQLVDQRPCRRQRTALPKGHQQSHDQHAAGVRPWPGRSPAPGRRQPGRSQRLGGLRVCGQLPDYV